MCYKEVNIYTRMNGPYGKALSKAIDPLQLHVYQVYSPALGNINKLDILMENFQDNVSYYLD